MVKLVKLIVVDSKVKVAEVLLKVDGKCEVFVEDFKVAQYRTLEECLGNENFLEVPELSEVM